MENKIIDNSIKMYDKTIQEMEEKGLDASEVIKEREILTRQNNPDNSIDEAFDEALKKVKPKKLTRDEMQGLINLHNISESNEAAKAKKNVIEVVQNKEEIRIKNEAAKLRRIYCNGLEDMYSVKEPARNNRFLVTIPDKYNTIENEITDVAINRRKHLISLAIRESLEQGQKKAFLDCLNEKSIFRIFKKSDDEIIIHNLKPNLTDDYCSVFSSVNVVDFDENSFNYSDESVHFMFVTFKYKNETTVNGTAYKKTIFDKLFEEEKEETDKK